MINCEKCNIYILECDCFVHMAGFGSAPPPSTPDNIINELRLFSDNIYKDFSGRPEIKNIENGVSISDKESYVNITYIPKSEDKKTKHGSHLELRVEGACYTSGIFQPVTTYEYKLVGEFAGYQEACREAFTHFMYQKCGDVWVDQF